MPRWLIILCLPLLALLTPCAANAQSQCLNTAPLLKWDGVTDDSASLTRAVSGALKDSTNGAACVMLPAGTGVLCKVSLPSFPNGLTILGAGIGITTIVPCNSASSVFSTASEPARYLEIGRFSILPRAAQSGGRFFDLRQIFNVNLHDIQARDGYDFAYFEEGYEVSICNTELRGFSGTVFYVNGGADYRWCSVNNYDDDDPTNGEAKSYLTVQKGGGIVLGAVDAIHCGDCYVFRTIAPGDHIEWIFASQTQADTCSRTGWTIDAAPDTRIIGFQGTGIWSASCGVGFATMGQGTIDGVSLIGPRIINNKRDGATFQSGTAIDLSDPTVTGNGGSNPGSYSGLVFGPFTKNFSVSGGRIGTFMQFSDSQLYNIDIQPGANRSYTIQNVNLCGHHINGAAIKDQSAKSTAMVRNNLCWNRADRAPANGKSHR